PLVSGPAGISAATAAPLPPGSAPWRPGGTTPDGTLPPAPGQSAVLHGLPQLLRLVSRRDRLSGAHLRPGRHHRRHSHLAAIPGVLQRLGPVDDGADLFSRGSLFDRRALPALFRGRPAGGGSRRHPHSLRIALAAALECRGGDAADGA